MKILTLQVQLNSSKLMDTATSTGQVSEVIVLLTRVSVSVMKGS